MGPRPSRFYFAAGDHWAVRRGDDGVIAVLETKNYTRRQFFMPCLFLPAIIALVGGVGYLITGKQAAFWAILMVAFAISWVVFFIYRIEWVQLKCLPREIFVLRRKHVIEVRGNTYQVESLSDLILDYTFFQPGVARGHGAFSELDVVINGGSPRHRINLLSQKSNWALKHARQLCQLTEIQLKRNVVAR